MGSSVNRSSKLLYGFIILVVFITTLFIFRVSILESIGNFLIYENVPTKSVPTFMLSGNPVERGTCVNDLYLKGNCQEIYVTGANYSPDLMAYGLKIKESQLSFAYLLTLGIDHKDIDSLPVGTSTYEELSEIRRFCEKSDFKQINIVSSKFHTRRIHKTARSVFKDSKISVFISGANAHGYEENRWWTSESGLLAVNNEYVKLVYYLLVHGF